MERASRLQPKGPKNFSKHHNQRTASIRPAQRTDTERVTQNTPLAQRDLPVFSKHSEEAVMVARLRRDQFTALQHHRNGPGGCTTDDAILLVEEMIPLFAITCSREGFRLSLDEWIERNTRLVTSTEVNEAIQRVLANPPPYTSAAIGRRHRVTIGEYDTLGLTHITPAGWTRKRLDQHLEARRARTVKTRRLAKGETKTPREFSISRLKLWGRPGAPCSSRAGFYRLSETEQAALVEKARAALRP